MTNSCRRAALSVRVYTTNFIFQPLSRCWPRKPFTLFAPIALIAALLSETSEHVQSASYAAKKKKDCLPEQAVDMWGCGRVSVTRQFHWDGRTQDGSEQYSPESDRDIERREKKYEKIKNMKK